MTKLIVKEDWCFQEFPAILASLKNGARIEKTVINKVNYELCSVLSSCIQQ